MMKNRHDGTIIDTIIDYPASFPNLKKRRLFVTSFKAR